MQASLFQQEKPSFHNYNSFADGKAPSYMEFISVTHGPLAAVNPSSDDRARPKESGRLLSWVTPFSQQLDRCSDSISTMKYHFAHPFSKQSPSLNPMTLVVSDCPQKLTQISLKLHTLLSGMVSCHQLSTTTRNLLPTCSAPLIQLSDRTPETTRK